METFAAFDYGDSDSGQVAGRLVEIAEDRWFDGEHYYQENAETLLALSIYDSERHSFVSIDLAEAEIVIVQPSGQSVSWDIFNVSYSDQAPGG